MNYKLPPLPTFEEWCRIISPSEPGTQIASVENFVKTYAIAAIEAQGVPDGWQPIETAPKDGTMFICWVSAVRYGETDEGQQYQEDASQIDFCAWRDGPRDLASDGYFDAFCGQIGDSQAVTHWMPLPTAPGASAPPAPQAKPQPLSDDRDARIAELLANEKVLLAQIQGHTQWREKIIKASEQAYGESAIRYKFSLTKSGKCMNEFPKEIDGRWFALAPAEDDGHIGHIARIAELEQRNRDLYEDVQRFKEHALSEKDARMALERELAAARKDAERWRWLQQEHARHDPLCHLSWKKNNARNGAEWVNTAQLEAAIDAAMKKEQPNG